VPAVPDQALHGALRRPHRRGGLRRARPRGAHLPRRPQPRHPGPAEARDGGGVRGARLRAGGDAARPAQGARPHSGGAGDQHPRRERRRRHRAAQPGRPALRAGLLLSGRAQLRQPRLLPERRPGSGGRRGARDLLRPVLQRADAAAAGAPVRGDAAAGRARGGAHQPRRAPGPRAGPAARRQARPRRARPHQRRAGARAPARRGLGAAPPARPAGRDAGPRRDAPARRGLRQQPHPGAPRDGVLHRGRPRGLRAGRLSHLQHQGRGERARRRLRDDARGVPAPLPQAHQGGPGAGERALAGPRADRRRPGPALLGGGDARRARHPRRAARRRGQGPGPPRRARGAAPRRRGAARARRARPRPLSSACATRRTASPSPPTATSAARR